MAPDGTSPGSSMDDNGADNGSDKDLDLAVIDARGEHARPRKRTRRACDKCSSSRTRCDGELPCRRCTDYGYSCRYNRTVKKRGRLPASAATAPPSAGSNYQAQTQSKSQSQTRDWPRQTTQESPREQNGDLPSLHSLVPPSTNLLSTRNYPMKLAEDGVILNQTLDRDDHMNHSQRMPGPPPRPHRASLSMGMTNRSTGPAQAEPTATTPGFRGYDEGPPRLNGSMGESAVIMSDDSVGQPSPENLANSAHAGHESSYHEREPALPPHGGYRGSFSTSVTATEPSVHEPQRLPQFIRSGGNECRYKFLEPVMPFIRKIMPASVACDLLDVYLTDPGSSLFRCASPYILTRIFRKASILHPTQPRRTSPALLTVMLWCSAQTADVMSLNIPSSRAKVLNELYDLAMALIAERDPDRWRRTQCEHSSRRVGMTWPN